ncbi:MAG: formylglycine-generating enzyme family protein [Phycisphaerae bacterium]
MGLKLFSRKKTETSRSKSVAKNASKSPGAPETSGRACDTRPETFVPAVRQPTESDVLARLAAQGRHQVMIRDREQWADHPDCARRMEEAARHLEASLAFVPEGSVTFRTSFATDSGTEEDVDVMPFLMAVCCVTNQAFQHFVDDNGYDNLDFWSEDIWPHLIEFKDQTGKPGPRYWRDGRHNAPLADHPVVGVSWFEATAFAKWAGLRLPTEAEWQMACSWHINSSADLLRRFPWGDAMDSRRCNIWTSRLGTTAPVDAFPSGAAPNHILQLVGNTWEWLSSDFKMSDEAGREIIAEMPMKCVRGGAFDTYFETQLTSEFRTGQLTLARAHNVGFRCALDLAEAVWLDEG